MFGVIESCGHIVEQIVRYWEKVLLVGNYLSQFELFVTIIHALQTRFILMHFASH